MPDSKRELGSRLREFHGAIGNVAMQIGQLGELSGGTMRDANAIVGAMETHQQSLSQSAGRLAQSQTALDEALDARRRSLESLVLLVDEKRSEFEGAVSTFSGLVDDSFRHVEARAREVGTLLTQSTQETAGLVDERFAQVRDAAAKERELTAAALRAAYEQANGELTKIFGQASEKFNTAAGEIRGLSLDIQRELEATRAEVRRGAQELPRETAEQAAALRRVVGDQVKALNELTDIVARSGRVYDIAEQAPALPPRRTFETPAAPAPAAAPQQAPRVASEPSWSASRNREEGAARARPPAPPAGRPPENAEAGQGWLSDLLARASRDEAPAPARPQGAAPRQKSPGALDTLTLDIARMVDHAAVTDLWEQFQRGEKGLFGRRLYTGQGVQTYEEIRRRYRADAEFRGTVDHYIQEFERLLMETVATIATAPWRAAISPRTPARSTPCSAMRRGVSSRASNERHRKGRHGKGVRVVRLDRRL